MGRPRRNDFEGAWHHLMNRGSDRQDIFSDGVDHRHFLSLVGETVDRGLMEVHAHCEMTNHFHLLVRSPRGEISSAMHRLESEYARWYNERHHRSGPLFTGRFVAVSVDTDEQLVTTGRYIHRNPLAKVLVDDLIAYPWSSYPVYVGHGEGPSWLRTDVLAEVSGMAPDILRSFVERDVPSDRPMRATERVPVSFEQIVAAVSHVTGVSSTAVLAAAPGTAGARQLLAMLAVELRVAATKELAELLGLSSAASVRVLARRGRVRVVDDAAFARCRSRALAATGYAVPGTGVTG
ncbi:MAG TPA: transposase [Ilumatobacteraceae bacterium]|nr:transposase [Ilumatobacteraceae bacterium]